MPLKLNELNSPPIVAVNCDNQSVMRKEKNGTQRGLENQKQNDNIEFRTKSTVTKWKSNLKSIKIWNMINY